VARRNPLNKQSAVLKLAAGAARRLPAPVKRLIYRVKPLARFLRRLLNRSAPDGLVKVAVAAGSLQGWELFLNLKLEKDYWLGTYETDLQQAVEKFVKRGSTAYDLGANIGYISLLLAKAAGDNGAVIAIEALPANFERLKQNTSLNQPHARVTCLNAAVTDKAGPVEFLVHSSTSMGKALGSAGRQEQYGQVITVPGVTLDSLVFDQGYPPPDVIKMDIEGGEVLAIEGMRAVLTAYHPLMMIELHGEEAADAVYPVLAAAGYDMRLMKEGYPHVRSRAEIDWKTYLLALPPQ